MSFIHFFYPNILQQQDTKTLFFIYLFVHSCDQFIFYGFNLGAQFWLTFYLTIALFFLYIGLQSKNAVYTVGDFMTKKEDLQVVKPTTTVDEGI